MALCCRNRCCGVCNDFTILLKYKAVKKYIILLAFLVFNSYALLSQCAMCRAVLESEEGQSTAEGVNDGIMYLMAVPYVLVGGIGFLIYWKYFRTKKVTEISS